MAAAGIRSGRAARATVAGLIASSLLIASLVIVAMSPFMGRASDDAGRGVSTRAAPECAAPKDERMPRDEHEDHSPCCIFCSAARDPASDAAEQPAITPPIARSRLWVAVAVSIDRIAATEHPLGWASSWSSQAPPRI
jgi:hypothetical protein